MSRPVLPQNLVLGCGTGYSPAQIAPFVSSLRESGFEGEIALVIYADQRELLAKLSSRFSLDLVPIPRHPDWLPLSVGMRLQNRGRMRWIHRSLGFILPPVLQHPGLLAFLGRELHGFFHISCSRYFIYYSYLHPRRRLYSNILLCDVRDTLFQSDPFRYSKGNGLCCFLDPAVCLGDEPINSEWMIATFGPAYCEGRQGRRIACSGTTLGDVASILSYLQKMCIELSRALPKISGLLGVDQAVHNFLIWEGQLSQAGLFENGEHAVMTLKHENLKSFSRDETGRLLNLDATPAPVLHQYDFHPTLVGASLKQPPVTSYPPIEISHQS